MQYFDYLKSINADYIQDVFTQYLDNPESVDQTWRYFFDGLALGTMSTEAAAGASAKDVVATTSIDFENEYKVARLIQRYRSFGHQQANVNPLAPATESPELQPKAFGLTDADLSKNFAAGAMLGMPNARLDQIIQKLKSSYCSTIGIELDAVHNYVENRWLEQRWESIQGNFQVPTETQKFILKRLTESESVEKFLHTRYVAQKRFSIEGGESLIPGLDAIIEKAADLGCVQVVLGMAHRGRLNVLINTMRKPAEHLFTEFDDNYPLDTKHGEGDVKYHKGHSLDMQTRNGKSVHMSLGFNPSHLEFIDPVIIGMTRAKQALQGDTEGNLVLPIMIHGDAAFAGQGVVYETLNASLLPGYKVGGTIHIISNNQVGFTTDPTDSRSTPYCTDLAQMLDAPIFHVNGDDPQAVWTAMQVATEFRYQFKKDVFVDIICYRKYGHNEGDEPSYTQPLLYKKINAHSTPRTVYANRLVAEGVVSQQETEQLIDNAIAPLDKALEFVRAQKPLPKYSEYEGKYWSKYRQATEEELNRPVQTSVDEATIKELATKMNQFPQGFTVHPKLARLFEARAHAFISGKGIDWGNAELMAYATLLKEGSTVRMTGQDVRRGTFTHRHAGVVDFETGQHYMPIAQFAESPNKLQIFNSHLSETAVMGIEYGFSVSNPDALVIWEAQFGDFANGAQVIIDQFIATSESKWHRVSGLTLLLPHGFEGQGPEHSSARMERFLQLCGKLNMQVAYVSTPAQLFHLLRRQVKRGFRKPLVLMTPKSLLRHPKVISDIGEFTSGHFKEVLDDSSHSTPDLAARVQRVILCSGKIYYELLDEREKLGRNDVALVRMEQFYPWPDRLLTETLEKYSGAKELFFVQEEPRNMGAWSYFHGMWTGGLATYGTRFAKLGLTYVGREVCASPAVGSKKLHDKEQREIIEKAFQK